ncbi:MAG: PH domain-containing protein [Rhodospirillales bacterium]|nr:PH domain-containing protein [Rhodospirillales bacterium]MCB9980583.1 PH domain-containing protein [Rhodospirillales bacterium]
MYYVQQSLGKNEELIHVGQFHWMYTLGAIIQIFWGVVLCIMVLIGSYIIQVRVFGEPDDGFISAVQHSHVGVRLLAFFMIIYGLLGFARMMIVKITTEIAVTNSRLIYKRGLVARYVGEIAIDRIEGVNFLQGIMGRLLNYGRVVVRGMGVGEVVLPPIADPVKFRRAIEKAKNS